VEYPNIPKTYRQLNCTASKIERTIAAGPNFSPDKAEFLNRLIKGALFSAAKGIRIKKDLSRTQYAAAVRAQWRASRAQKLQSGGVLEISQVRNMVQRRQEDEAIKAQRILKASKRKLHNITKGATANAAKAASRWRSLGILNRAEIVETGRPKRHLLRFKIDPFELKPFEQLR
jgi:hypothetical protein